MDGISVCSALPWSWCSNSSLAFEGGDVICIAALAICFSVWSDSKLSVWIVSVGAMTIHGLSNLWTVNQLLSLDSNWGLAPWRNLWIVGLDNTTVHRLGSQHFANSWIVMSSEPASEAKIWSSVREFLVCTLYFFLIKKNSWECWVQSPLPNLSSNPGTKSELIRLCISRARLSNGYTSARNKIPIWDEALQNTVNFLLLKTTMFCNVVILVISDKWFSPPNSKMDWKKSLRKLYGIRYIKG